MIVAVAALLFTTGAARAQLIPVLGGQRAGTAALTFLKLGVGARAAGMGETFVAIANDASALFWNPAGMMEFSDDQVLVSRVQWPVDIRHDFVGYVRHFGDANAIGISVISLHMDDMEETTEYRPRGTGNFFTFGDIAVGLSYARRLTDRFSAGATVRYVEETLAEVKTRGVLVDIGTLYWTGYRTARFGMAVTNFGPNLRPGGTLVSGGQTITEFQSFAPPTIFRFAFAMEVLQNESQRLTTSLQLNHPNDNSESVNFGLEYSLNETLLLRGGYRLNVDEESYSFGAGLHVPTTFARLNIDVAYTDFGRLGNATRAAVLISF
jgi:hypothetical protein